MKIPFNRNYRAPHESRYIHDVTERAAYGSPYPYLERCRSWLGDHFDAEVLVTQSCTDALELAALLCSVGPGDEVILPSFTFSSTATAFALRGAELVFSDIDPVTLNIDVSHVERLVTARTRVIVAVNYAGNPCDTDALRSVCDRGDIILVEDAAQSLMTERDGRQVGGESDLTTVSFHNTKNIHCGEGGALVVNNPRFVDRAHVLAEKGTDRRAFFLGHVDKYSWVDIGTSALPSELTCALLLSQLEAADRITSLRRQAWGRYRDALIPLAEPGHVVLPAVADGVDHNAHIFHLRLPDRSARDGLIGFLAEQGISAPFHYVPLHRSKAGVRFSRTDSPCPVSDHVSDTLLRLPLWPGVPTEAVSAAIHRFFDLDVGHDVRPESDSRRRVSRALLRSSGTERSHT